MRATSSWTLLLCCFVAFVAAPAVNITFTLPEGTSNHGNPNLLCTPTSWTDVIVFFLGNYAAHAATIYSFFYETKWDKRFNALRALFIPAFGFQRAIFLIMSFAILGKSDLEVATRSGVLVMLVRASNWRPLEGDSLRSGIFRRPHQMAKEKDSPGGNGIHLVAYDGPWLRNTMKGPGNLCDYQPNAVHGSPKVPDGYQILAIPTDAIVEPLPADEPSCSIVYNYNFVKLSIALGQVLYAITTLYRARGNQISQFGYVAFGLTVPPYLIMSAFNLLGNLACPEYSEVYLVESGVLDEARARGGKFHSTVGRLVEDFDAKFRIAEEVPDLLIPCRPISISLENGALQAEIDLPVNKVVVTEDKPVLSTTGKAITNEIPKDAGRNSVEIVQSESGNHRFRLLEGRDNYKGFEQIDEPILFVPSCNVLRTSRVSVQDKGLVVEGVSWNDFIYNFDISFAGWGGGLTRQPIAALLSVLVAGLTFAIIGGMTQFHPGHSTLAQRVWIMSWLCLSNGYFILFLLIYALTHPVLQSLVSRKHIGLDQLNQIPLLITHVVIVPVVIGGFVVVGQMLKSYGSCILIP